MQIPFPRVLRILQKRVSRKPITRGGVLKKGSLTNITYVLYEYHKKSKLDAFVYFANFLTEMTSISPKKKSTI